MYTLGDQLLQTSCTTLMALASHDHDKLMALASHDHDRLWPAMITADSGSRQTLASHDHDRLMALASHDHDRHSFRTNTRAGSSIGRSSTFLSSISSIQVQATLL